ncbi:gamma-glutamylcyclotransferase family protein [Phycisphaera mikurensis]|uniref:Gamma-glutamylcyclotransferase AIG2-like domain-containing protein n=1 Tax=Phycisphaera mikurensis (strain NBRC 102666 / KCTC 22515 / FYK2301M01) TaxID=1142394 RepID=I0IFQ0_PHYMF|nr:gamma-glutamylcyclotransferase family protein [Phycisphaera mikurensis]MBB6440522.1 gamma-glutamylcyclotransferase (GGCT)/AIG2-like uncharacterized protein YtfP [Phycisphaera mikurensis]BAM04088.1 hypothetical protein PSMK_19290 [Phycisphaera mikurensis NBRC 102666]
MAPAPQPADRELLFAYGTLIRGGPPAVAAAMRRHTRALGAARVAGRLHDAGDWPALLPASTPADRVPGMLFEVHGPRELWPVLDAWEGCGAGCPRPHLFRREKAPVDRVEAWVYFFNGSVDGWPRIAHWPPAS